jgi:hypothetical protein
MCRSTLEGEVRFDAQMLLSELYRCVGSAVGWMQLPSTTETARYASTAALDLYNVGMM